MDVDLAVPIGLAGLALASFAFWRAWQLPHVRAVLPAWIWPVFWIGTILAGVVLVIFWTVSL